MKTCGCTTETCGCCEGVKILTPLSTYNRPGLPALQYRVGTQAAFLETMKARLSAMTVGNVGPDGQAQQPIRPLQGLTTRDSSDPSIALLDAWATVGDVLTFYQERIANEGYLRTATERRSILELSRLIGYTLRPGVASSVYLAYTIDDNQTDPVEIPIGARSQSVPPPGQMPQSFETSESLLARSDWNNLQARLTQPQDVSLDKVSQIDQIQVLSTAPPVKPGDTLVFQYSESADLPYVLRKVQSVNPDFPNKRIALQLVPYPEDTLAGLLALNEMIQDLEIKIDPHSLDMPLHAAVRVREQIYHGLKARLEQWPSILRAALNDPGHDRLINRFAEQIRRMADRRAVALLPPAVTSPSQFVTGLLKPTTPQVANSLRLPRNLTNQFPPNADTHAQLLVNFAPTLKDTFYTAWSNANVNPSQPELQAAYVMAVSATIFGATAPPMMTYPVVDGFPTPTPVPWSKAPDEAGDAIWLDKDYPAIMPGTPAVIQITDPQTNETRVEVLKIIDVITAPRTAYGISSKSTRLTFDRNWIEDTTYAPSGYGGFPDLFGDVRGVLVLAQAEELPLAETPIDDPFKTATIKLAGLYNELKSGRWVIVSGERRDIPGVSGVNAAELMMISSLHQSFDQALPGDQTQTTLVLSSAPAYSYKPKTVKIYANVVKATNGETRNETLGSGDGSQAFQSFMLKQPPLTFVPATNPQGVDSTLKVYVNNIEWHESSGFVEAGPKDRIFITRTGDDDKVTVVFGNGEEGARLPTGVENVTAIYRNGIGSGGNVQAGKITLLQTRPLGVRAVINPLPATGGADKENRDQARDNAPIGVSALDRLVSIQDYADFTRTFAGIGKAASRRLSDGKRELVHVTIAGADDIPIDPTSDLFQNLVSALRQFGDPSLPIEVQLRELKVLILSANVKLSPDYQWELVVIEIRTTLLDVFGFQKRALGQPVFLSEVISTIQNIEGVAYVDVVAFGAVPEKKAAADGTRVLLTLDEIANTIAVTGVPQWVEANLADPEQGGIRPAQLAIMTNAVPDTLILNQIV
jgi:hypothetical protein